MVTSDQTMIAALLRERASYEQQKKPDRVEQVNDQLHRLGHTDDEDQGEGEPTGRTPEDPAQQTAAETPAPAATLEQEAQETKDKPPAKKTAAARRQAG
ncbi:hypothetical protein ACFT7S_28200 [Streptomyces sp. NPDC057136]|uniref:hypothetical protein n=1 Tax=Streptomyces sp. NPDC057136 TaxID=3346029 RepID=UPI00363ADEA8